MFDFLGPVVIGIMIIVLGVINTKGNINTIHWYHRKRVAEEDVLPFGRLIGSGTIIIGVCIAVMGLCNFAAMKTGNTSFTLLGSIIMVVGLVVGLGLSFYAMMKYNKGIF